jgi:hypothetical protein
MDPVVLLRAGGLFVLETQNQLVAGLYVQSRSLTATWRHVAVVSLAG